MLILAACHEPDASAHGVLYLFVDVPRSGTPSVRVHGDLADTADADCVSKALLATVIDERVTPPVPSGEVPIAVKL